MPRPEKAERRDKQRQKRNQMPISGRGLLTDIPDWEGRLQREQKARKRKKRKR